MYINTITIGINEYTTNFMNCPPFSKILDIRIGYNKSMVITYSSESYVYPSDYTKSFYFHIIKGNCIVNMSVPTGYVFFKTIRAEENDFIEFYTIFIQENKTLDELRDSKIEEVISV